jgi:hypothetical protein
MLKILLGVRNVGLALTHLRKKLRTQNYIYFFLAFGPGQLTNFISSFIYEAGFYKPNVLKVHPPICRITAYATMPG